MDNGTASTLTSPPTARVQRRAERSSNDVQKPLLIALLTGLTCLTGLMYSLESWTPLAMVVVPGLVAVAIARYSLLASVYVAAIGILYGVTNAILGLELMPEVVPIVLLSALAVGIGAVCAGTKTRSLLPVTWPEPGILHFIVVFALMLVQTAELRNGESGLTSQLNRTVDSGSLLSILSGAGSTMALMLLAACFARGRNVFAASLLMAWQILVIVLGGSRGGGPSTLICIAIIAALVLPKSSPWRSKKRVIALFLAGITAGIALFSLGAISKDAASAAFRGSEVESSLYARDEALYKTAERLDLNSPLQMAIAAKDDSAVQAALSWQGQIIAIIPRALWPEKPSIDYAQQVSVTVYGLPYGLTSTTIARVGDTLVNFGAAGLVAVGVTLGVVLSLAERYIRNRPGILALAIAAGLSQAVLAHESPIVIALIGTIRAIALAAALWWVCGIVGRVLFTTANPQGQASTDRNSNRSDQPMSEPKLVAVRDR